MKRRMLAMLLAVCLIAGMLPMAASAAESTTVQTAKLHDNTPNGIADGELHGSYSIQQSSPQPDASRYTSYDVDIKNLQAHLNHDLVGTSRVDYWVGTSFAPPTDQPNVQGMRFTYATSGDGADVINRDMDTIDRSIPLISGAQGSAAGLALYSTLDGSEADAVNPSVTGVLWVKIQWMGKSGNDYVAIAGLEPEVYKINYTGTLVFPDRAITIPSSIEGGSVAATVNSTAATAAKKGETVTLTAAPEAGYALSTLTVNGGAVTVTGTGNSRTFTMPDEAVTVAATFEKQSYKLTLPAASNGCTVTAEVDSSNVASESTVEYGKTVTLTVNAATGYHLKTDTLKYNDGADHPLTPDGNKKATFTMPAAAVTVSAEFEADQPVVTPVYGTAAWDGGFTGGKACTGMASPTTDEATHITTFNVTGPVEWYPASVSPSRNAGHMVGVTITPPAGFTPNDTDTKWTWGTKYVDAKWSVGKDDGANTLTYYPTFTASSLTDTFTITWKEGSTQTFKVVVADASQLKPQWPTISGLGTLTNGSVTATSKHADRTQVDVINESSHVQPGAVVTLTPTAGDGYKVKSALTVKDNTNTPVTPVTAVGDGTFTFTVPTGITSLTLEDPFEADGTPAPTSYTVTVDNSITHGTVTADKNSAAETDTVTLTITPDAEYELDTLYYTDTDGSNQVNITTQGTAADERTFAMPAKNVVVHATFTAKTYNITINAGSGGTVTANPNPAAKDAIVTLTVAPDSGKQLKAGTLKVKNGDVPLSGTGPYTFTMPGEAVTVTAEFEDVSTPSPTSYNVTVSDSIAHGTVTADPTSAEEGASVTLTVEAERGYTIGTVTYTPAEGSAITIHPDSNGAYKFEMPAANVTVSATFRKQNTGGGTGGSSPVDPAPVDPDPVDPSPVDPEPVVSTETADDGTVTTTTTWDDGQQAVAVKSPEGEKTITVTTASGEKVADVKIPAQPAEAKEFDDVQTSWYKDAVETAIGYGLFNGTSETEFSPNNGMTRAMLATVLYNLSGKPEYGTDTSVFNDVETGRWYEDPVDWAYKVGVTSGTSDTEFSPYKNITREQLVTMLYNYAKKIGAASSSKTAITDFPDGDKVARYAKDAMEWAVAEGFISGRAQNGTSYIAPKGTASRAEVAAVLTRFVEYLKK